MLAMRGSFVAILGTFWPSRLAAGGWFAVPLEEPVGHLIEDVQAATTQPP